MIKHLQLIQHTTFIERHTTAVAAAGKISQLLKQKKKKNRNCGEVIKQFLFYCLTGFRSNK